MELAKKQTETSYKDLQVNYESLKQEFDELKKKYEEEQADYENKTQQMIVKIRKQCMAQVILANDQYKKLVDETTQMSMNQGKDEQRTRKLELEIQKLSYEYEQQKLAYQQLLEKKREEVKAEVFAEIQ